MPDPANQTLSPTPSLFRSSCGDGNWTLVDVNRLVRSADPKNIRDLPDKMYTRTNSLGVGSGGHHHTPYVAYGLVGLPGTVPDPATAQCDYNIGDKGKNYTAVYLGINAQPWVRGVGYEPGGNSNRVHPNTMGIWFRGGQPSDDTPPDISASRDPSANINGWNNAPVTGSYTASDADSGIDAGASDLGDDVFGEGSGQVAEGTAFDNAGNSATATVTDINVDLTKPTISAVRDIDPNVNGWNNSDVTVSYEASDAGTKTIAFEGGSGAFVNTPYTESGLTLNMDPISLPSNPHFHLDSGGLLFHNGDGNDRGTFDMNGAAFDLISFELDEFFPSPSVGFGTNVITASNGSTLTVTSPGTVVLPAGWTGITSFTWAMTPPAANDARALMDNLVVNIGSSGLDGVASDLGNDVLGQGVGQSADGTAVDLAGNSASASITNINVDKTDPIVTATRTPVNVNGWNNGPVEVTFSATDDLSGIDGVPIEIVSMK